MIFTHQGEESQVTVVTRSAGSESTERAKPTCAGWQTESAVKTSLAAPSLARFDESSVLTKPRLADY